MQTHRFIQTTPYKGIAVRLEPQTASDDPLTTEELAFHMLADKIERKDRALTEIKERAEDVERGLGPKQAAREMFDIAREALK
jgi:hypothetical protein|tara:strand:+ start:9037 stop:9285 length:249 start_codon:yes stop_codon:yes gene_type:complete